MDFTIRSAGSESFVLSDKIPAGPGEYHIPGSKAKFLITGSGSCFLQLVEADVFAYLYCVFSIEKATSFILSSFGPSCFVHIILEGNRACELRHPGVFSLRESQANIFYTPFFHCGLTFERKQVYRCIYMMYPPDFVLRSLKFFPLLAYFSQSLARQTDCILNGKEVFANARCMDMIYRLLHAPYADSIKDFHLDIMKELLFEIFRQASAAPGEQKRFPIEQVEKIYAAKALIDVNLPRHLSIQRISGKLGINEEQLKKGFKAIYGVGLYAYLQNAVLNIAKTEVEETGKSVKAIAYHAGYRSASNFSIAFKKKFGLSPSAWRIAFNRQKINF